MEKIRVVVKKPNKPAHITEIGSSLEEMQNVVGGHIEIIPAEAIVGSGSLPKDKLLLVFDEEGKYKDLEPNIPIYGFADWIMGTAFVCKAEGDEMVGLTEPEAELVLQLLSKREEGHGQS